MECAARCGRCRLLACAKIIRPTLLDAPDGCRGAKTLLSLFGRYAGLRALCEDQDILRSSRRHTVGLTPDRARRGLHRVGCKNGLKKVEPVCHCNARHSCLIAAIGVVGIIANVEKVESESLISQHAILFGALQSNPLNVHSVADEFPSPGIGTNAYRA